MTLMGKIAGKIGDTQTQFTANLQKFLDKVLNDTLSHAKKKQEELDKNFNKELIFEKDFTPCLNILEQLENVYNDIIAGDKNEE